MVATPKSGFHVCYFREQKKKNLCFVYHLKITKRFAVFTVIICGMRGRVSRKLYARWKQYFEREEVCVLVKLVCILSPRDCLSGLI